VQLPHPSHPPHSPSAVSTQLAQTLACSLIFRLLQRCASRHSMRQHPEATVCSEQCSADRSSGAKAITHQATTTRQLHWLQVQHRITYKLAVLAYKVRTTSTPAYLSRHIRLRDSVRTLYARPQPLDCLNRSPVQHLPSVHSTAQLPPPGTISHNQLLTATH